MEPCRAADEVEEEEPISNPAPPAWCSKKLVLRPPEQIRDPAFRQLTSPRGEGQRDILHESESAQTGIIAIIPAEKFQSLKREMLELRQFVGIQAPPVFPDKKKKDKLAAGRGVKNLRCEACGATFRVNNATSFKIRLLICERCPVVINESVPLDLHKEQNGHGRM